MSKAYKSALTFICLLIVVSISLGIAYLFYDKDVSESTIVLVDGNLSINYLDGNVIKNKEENYDMRFSVTNNSDEEVSYSINIEEVKNENEDIGLVITNKTLNSVVCETELPKDEKSLVSSVQIASGETHNYIINVNNNASSVFSGILKINEEKTTITTFAQTILKNNAVSNTTLTNVGVAVAIEDEGLISDIDDAGSTYYFRGGVTDNYVSFADLTWRIVRINGDGTIKMILDTTIDTVQPFYSNNEDEEFYKYDYSSIKEYLESWYEFNLQNYDEYVAIDKYCNDFTTTNDTDYVYNSYVRNVTNKIPTFNCLGKNVGAKIGLITVDEVIYAGGLYKENNTSFYLYNSKITGGWWTLTPGSGNATSMNPFIVNESGMINNDVVGTYNRGVRPVISLIKDIAVTGSGTSTDPYTLDYETK